MAGDFPPQNGGQRWRTKMEYRGIGYETWKDGGFIVDIEGDEVFCDNLDAVKQLIDEYLG